MLALSLLACYHASIQLKVHNHRVASLVSDLYHQIKQIRKSQHANHIC